MSVCLAMPITIYAAVTYNTIPSGESGVFFFLVIVGYRR
jgi:hypothetical protein